MSDFKPVEFIEPKGHGLRPLFTGRVANTLDSVANVASGMFGMAFVVIGLCVFAYNLAVIAIVLTTRSAWLPLSGIALFTFVVGFFFLRSSLIPRLVIACTLAAFSLLLSPAIERLLS